MGSLSSKKNMENTIIRMHFKQALSSLLQVVGFKSKAKGYPTIILAISDLRKVTSSSR